MSLQHIFTFFCKIFDRGKTVAAVVGLLLSEGLAVGALIHGGVALVGANQNAIQGAVVCLITVMSTLLNGTFNALICVTVHIILLLLLGWC